MQNVSYTSWHLLKSIRNGLLVNPFVKSIVRLSAKNKYFKNIVRLSAKNKYFKSIVRLSAKNKYFKCVCQLYTSLLILVITLKADTVIAKMTSPVLRLHNLRNVTAILEHKNFHLFTYRSFYVLL